MLKTRIEVILGCMFSGKSTELLRRTARYKAIGKNVLLINHIYDIRTNESIRTHSDMKQTALKTDRLLNIYKLKVFNTSDVIGIDEAQFFPDLLEFIKRTERLNKLLLSRVGW